MNRTHRLLGILRHKQKDPEDTVKLKIAVGDVADVLPVDLWPTRSFDEDRAELDAFIEALAQHGALDAGTGGHLADEWIEARHAQVVADLQRRYLVVEATSEHLIGAAEQAVQAAREALGLAADEYRRAADRAEHAERELVGELRRAALEHDEQLRRASGRSETHGSTCEQPRAFTPPWAQDETPRSNGRRRTS